MDMPSTMRSRTFSRGQLTKKSKNVEEENARLRDMLQQALSREADALRKLKHLQLKYMELLSKSNGSVKPSDCGESCSPLLNKKPAVAEYTLDLEGSDLAQSPSNKSPPSTNGISVITTDSNGQFPQLIVQLDQESDDDCQVENGVTVNKVCATDMNGVASLAPLPQGLRTVKQEREKPPPLRSGDSSPKGTVKTIPVVAQQSPRPQKKAFAQSKQLSFSDENINQIHRLNSDPSAVKEYKNNGSSNGNRFWKRKSRQVIDIEDIEGLFKKFTETHNDAPDPLSEYLDVHWSTICLESNCTQEERKYRDAVWEIFQTEAKYLTCQLQPLEQVYKSFLEELHFYGILTNVNTDRIFGNLSQLIELTSVTANDLLKLFERRSASSIAQINELILAFSMFGHNFNPVYKSYCTNLEQQRSYIKQLEQIFYFQEYVKVCRTAPSVQKNDLHGLLITPMQHQVHYKLLLENVLKRTQDPNNRASLSSVIQAFKVSLQELNSAIAANKTSLELKDLCNSVYWPPVTQLPPETFIPPSLSEFTRQQQQCSDVISTDRYLVMQGGFKLLDTKGKPYTDLHLILLNDLLLVTEVIKGGQYKRPFQYEMLHHPFELENLKVHRPPANLRPMLVIIPVSPIGQQLCVFSFIAPSLPEREKWYSQLLSMGSKLI